MPVTTMRDMSGFYKCDGCGKTFKATEVLRKKKTENFEILTPGMDPLESPDGELFACPCCGEIHLWGFDRAA